MDSSIFLWKDSGVWRISAAQCTEKPHGDSAASLHRVQMGGILLDSRHATTHKQGQSCKCGSCKAWKARWPVLESASLGHSQFVFEASEGASYLQNIHIHDSTMTELPPWMGSLLAAFPSCHVSGCIKSSWKHGPCLISKL